MDFLSGLSAYFGNETYSLIILPLFIMFARVIDVSLGTLRIILISKGYRSAAPILGFVESFIWVLAVSQIMQNLNSIYLFAMYALGFALGTYVGMVLEGRLSLGQVIVRVITKHDASELVARLIKENHNLTTTDAEGQFGKVKIIFIVMKRDFLNDAISIIKSYNPQAFYTVEDLKFVRDGSLPGMQNYEYGSKKTPMRKAFSMRK